MPAPLPASPHACGPVLPGAALSLPPSDCPMRARVPACSPTPGQLLQCSKRCCERCAAALPAVCAALLQTMRSLAVRCNTALLLRRACPSCLSWSQRAAWDSGPASQCRRAAHRKLGTASHVCVKRWMAPSLEMPSNPAERQHRCKVSPQNNAGYWVVHMLLQLRREKDSHHRTAHRILGTASRVVCDACGPGIVHGRVATHNAKRIVPSPEMPSKKHLCVLGPQNNAGYWVTLMYSARVSTSKSEAAIPACPHYPLFWRNVEPRVMPLGP